MRLSSSISCACNLSYCKKIFHYNKKPKHEKNYSIIGAYKRSFYECEHCKHIFAKLFFKFKKLYSKEYFQLTYKDEKNLEKRFNLIKNLSFKNSDNKNRVERIKKYFIENNIKKKTKEVLDVGSGIGIFLFEMKKLNWKTYGIEFDKRYSNFCRKKLNINISNNNFLNLNTRKKYDLITFNKVLEHIAQPKKLLRYAAKILKKNGVIYIEVPDSKVKLKGKFRNEFCPDHLHLFSEQSLSLLTNNTGLEINKIQRIIDPSGKFTIFTFLKNKEL